MFITAETLLPDVLRLAPSCRPVLDRYGLAGCGGRYGPHETLAFFARAHQVDQEQLLRELRRAASSQAPTPEYAPGPGDTIYRSFFRGGIVAMFTAGGVFGAILLALHAWERDLTLLDYRAAVWAHAHVQIAGWVTLFVMGFAYQAFPRFKQTRLARPSLAAATLWMMLIGLAAKFFAGLVDQSLSGQIVGGLAGLLELTAVVCFVWILAETWNMSIQPRQPWEKYVFAALGWMILAFLADLAVFAATGWVHGDEAWVAFISLYDAPWRDIQLLGFAGGMILGVSQRFLPFICGFRAVPDRLSSAIFWLWNGAVAVGIGSYMAFMESYRPAWGALWLLSVLAMLVCVLALPRSMRLFAPAPETDRSLRFIRSAYVWAGIAFVMLLLTPVYSRAVGMGFSHAWFGAFRHALTVGFISLMIVGVSSKVAPVLAGVDPARLSGLRAAFWLINIGCAMRVGFQVLTDLFGWAFPPAAASAPVELTGFALWALDLLRTMRTDPDVDAARYEGPITPDWRVADVLAAHPETEPTFLAHGFDAISNPVLRRTVARRVTLAQACRLRGVSLGAFIADLRAAQSRSTSSRLVSIDGVGASELIGADRR
jgi:uncharacterized protein involved in response to NO